MLSLSFKLKFFNFFLPSSIFFAVLDFISFAFLEVSIFNLFDVHFAYSLLNLSYLVQSSEYEIVKLNKYVRLKINAKGVCPFEVKDPTGRNKGQGNRK